MSKRAKSERKRRVHEWPGHQLAKLMQSAPLTPSQLNELLDHLDANLRECDHSTRLTVDFLQAANLEPDRVVPWLGEQGGYCDCEVLANLEDLAESFRQRPAPPQRPQPKQKAAPRDLQNPMGWDLSALPSPWRLANLYSPHEPLHIQMGKKPGCSIQIVEASLPDGDRASDEYWSQLWYARTELPEKSPMRVSRDARNLPGTLQSVLVQNPAWTPVYCWVLSDDSRWYLEVRTESNRQQGDLALVGKLLTQLAATKAV